MSFKLIRNATLVGNLSESELNALIAMKVGSSVQEASDEKMQLWTADSGGYDVNHPERHKSIGYFKTQSDAKTALDKSPNKAMMGPIHQLAGYASWIGKNINESFNPSDDDFDVWMRVVVGEAGERGVNLGKKSDFMQIAMDVLENDPASPPLSMQEMIAGKLWQDYNSAKQAVRINKLAAANEEEEKVKLARKQIADRFAQGTTPTVPPSYDEEESGYAQALKASVGMEEEEPSFVRDALRDGPPTSMKGSFSSHLRGEDEFDDTEADENEVSFGPTDAGDGSDEDVFTSDDECECSCDDDEMSDEFAGDELSDDELSDDDLSDDDLSDDELSDDEFADDTKGDVEPRAPKKGFDEEEAVKSFFRQAVTSPNDMMRQAVKDIESEGKTAWRKANVPTNPHPQKSQAHRAWQKGLTTAAKEALGIVDKSPAAKPKRKK